ncbi:ABC transporter substrate-binding protein [Mesotoga sp. Brook.08.YT.4.2.5.1]|uniref:transporter substrate-binding domain-containing protein n=1 Tax=unclassified Mesotoga TaxID=1184398 RepID=UPI000C180587|nr:MULTISPECIES: transporter substrate-binding domain-containing protein [unclassified Mesotoga]PNQ05754.1 ABC transporter substrate-binding protein [Mesotoga sp. SC_NapDC3]PXF35017.1 ABC transporter substrate-binding protein [Mesotoga sp. SC_NapDC]RIZ61321.1 ABC transporter substrate-binding protein [Mesotoga sp. SC_NapDC2]PNE18095.1 ABC transporter substrate-binding protein [Mesotoga sp. Brook.08.YT.4.2.5.1]PNS41402.1 ABC transporter substrate-binding protein [Mesotoga sp. B105.6.4]
MKKFLVLAVLICMTMAFGSLIDDVRQRGVLRVGQDAGYMPLYGTNPDGERIGLEVEILERMAEILGVKLEFVVVNWDGIIPALMSNKFDIIWSAMTITPERALRVNFSDPYLTVGQIILYNTNRYTVPPTEEDLDNPDVKIAVQLGSTGAEAATRLLSNAQIFMFETIDEAAFQVASGRADAMIFDSIYARFMAKKYDQLDVTEELLTREDFGVAIANGDFETLQWLNTFIQWVKTTGTLEELENYWFVEYQPEF